MEFLQARVSAMSSLSCALIWFWASQWEMGSEKLSSSLATRLETESAKLSALHASDVCVMESALVLARKPF
jgi:hypothetical protein